MDKKCLGNSELSFSVIGLGTWAIGGGGWAMGWGAQEDRSSIAALLKGFEQGINWVDTAPVYGWGRSEQVVGKALREWGGEVFVATKCGILRDDRGKPVRVLKRASVVKECEDSLRRLRREAIDLYQIHWPEPDEDIEEAYEVFSLLRQQGKIRYGGVSNFSRSQLERVAAIDPQSPPCSLQSPYSLLARDIESEQLPWCKEHGCGVLAYSPLQCGLLTGKVTGQWIDELPPDDWRKKKNKFFQPPRLEHALKLVEELSATARERNLTMSQLAIAWVLAGEQITSAIVGVRNPEQAAALARAAEVRLDADALARMRDISDYYFDSLELALSKERTSAATAA